MRKLSFTLLAAIASFNMLHAATYQGSTEYNYGSTSPNFYSNPSSLSNSTSTYQSNSLGVPPTNTPNTNRGDFDTNMNNNPINNMNDTNQRNMNNNPINNMNTNTGTNSSVNSYQR